MFRYAMLVLALLMPSVAAAQDKITRETMTSGGRTRVYYLYVPSTLKADEDAPLLVLLHGSGRDGKSIVEPWKDLAKKEGIILAGPNATDRAGWDLKADGPYFVADLIDVVRSNQKVDLKRLYLFGHSAGAIQGLTLGLLESEYFAAVAVHAGALPRTSFDLIPAHDRKIPFAIWVGTNDPYFPMEAVEATKTAMEQAGLTVMLKPIRNHTHNYYQLSDDINREAWAFLKDQRLSGNPRFKEWDIK